MLVRRSRRRGCWRTCGDITSTRGRTSWTSTFGGCVRSSERRPSLPSVARDTVSMPLDRLRRLAPSGAWLDVAWGVFTLLNLIGMIMFPDWETVPFHFIWVSLTILYGLRVWGSGPTLGVLSAIVVLTGIGIYIDVMAGYQQPDELTEVPLMAAMFLAMVWHARRRATALDRLRRVSEADESLAE